MCALLVVLGVGCNTEPGDDGDSGGDGTGSEDTGDGDGDGENYVRGIFVDLDDGETSFSADAQHLEFTFGDRDFASCGGDGEFALGVTYEPAVTGLGEAQMDLLEGPYVVLGWEVDGGMGHGTATANGTLEFTEVGAFIAGTAHVMPMVEDGNPDDLYKEVKEIEFRCRAE